MTIKKATVSDLELIVPLFDAYRVFYKQGSDPTAARELYNYPAKTVLCICSRKAAQPDVRTVRSKATGAGCAVNGLTLLTWAS